MKPFLFSIIMLITTSLFAQQEITWTFSYAKNPSELLFTATLADGWHVYSILPNDGGPVPTSFEIETNSSFTLKGNILEPNPTQVYDENFATNVHYFSKEVTFRQAIIVNEQGIAKGNVVYMICNDQMCFPPEEVQFSIPLTK